MYFERGIERFGNVCYGIIAWQWSHLGIVFKNVIFVCGICSVSCARGFRRFGNVCYGIIAWQWSHSETVFKKKDSYLWIL